jgi:RNA-binding protein Musashi
MMDKDTGRPRGFGFVTFESEAGVDACLAQELEIHGKPIEVKKAQPRGNMREEEEANRRAGGGPDAQGTRRGRTENRLSAAHLSHDRRSHGQHDRGQSLLGRIYLDRSRQ